MLISGACTASPVRWAGSGWPDLLHLKLEIVQRLGLIVGWPHLHSPLLGQQMPAEAGTIALRDVHLPAQSRDTAHTFVAGTGELHHQIRTAWRETTPLLGAEPLPTIEGDLISPEKQAHCEPSVAGSCFTFCGHHHHQSAVGSGLQSSLSILGADHGELLGCETQLRRKPQRREAIGARGVSGDAAAR